MIKAILQLLFCLLVQSAFGQSNRYYALIKTHPAAYLVGNFNLSAEIGKGEDPHDRLTLTVFWLNKNSIGPYPTHQLLDHGDSGSGFEVHGLSYRLGYKNMLKLIANTKFYFEPQFRFAKTVGIFNNLFNSNPYIEVYNSKITTTQGVALLGFQKLNKKKTFVFDGYVGLGYMTADITNTLKISTFPNFLSPIGTIWKRQNKGMRTYLGTSIGIVLGNKKKD
jgi:hypothetical protein